MNLRNNEPWNYATNVRINEPYFPLEAVPDAWEKKTREKGYPNQG